MIKNELFESHRTLQVTAEGNGYSQIRFQGLAASNW